LQEAVFRLRPGELSTPIRTDRGYVVLTVKESLPAHQGTFPEVRERVLGDFRREKATELAATRAKELAQRVASGEALGQVAKALGFEVKTSEPFARTGAVAGVASARQLAAAFATPLGKSGAPVALGGNWVVYRVVDREEAKPEEFEKQRKELEQQVLQLRRQLAYEAFRIALQERMKREGKLRINAENLKRLTSPT